LDDLFGNFGDFIDFSRSLVFVEKRTFEKFVLKNLKGPCKRGVSITLTRTRQSRPTTNQAAKAKAKANSSLAPCSSHNSYCIDWSIFYNTEYRTQTATATAGRPTQLELACFHFPWGWAAKNEAKQNGGGVNNSSLKCRTHDP